VANYVRRSDEPPPDGFDDWEKWLQRHRVELNAMTSSRFITWLDSKMAAFDVGKVVPPQTVLRERLAAETRQVVRARAVERILSEVGIDAIVDAQMAGVEDQLAAVDPGREVTEDLAGRPDRRWSEPLADLAAKIAAAAPPSPPAAPPSRGSK
jgi:hypothetical protein